MSRCLLAVALSLALGLSPAWGDQSPAPVTRYMGREIAQTMHWSGAEWLERSTREREESVEEMLGALAVRPGMMVCDLGCGSGYHAVRLARMVAPGGRVFAVDVQAEMLALTEKAAAAAGLTNVHTIRALAHDPRLPRASCDLVLMVDVYHELSHPVQVLAGVRAALKPRGRLALVEFRAEDPAVPIKKLHKMTRAQAVRELGANGFTPAGAYDGLPWQHLLFFGATRPSRN
jgi:ubiquinone/menaquinone biosynthesis C-methylase UbiE